MISYPSEGGKQCLCLYTQAPQHRNGHAVSGAVCLLRASPQAPMNAELCSAAARSANAEFIQFSCRKLQKFSSISLTALRCRLYIKRFLAIMIMVCHCPKRARQLPIFRAIRRWKCRLILAGINAILRAVNPYHFRVARIAVSNAQQL